MGIVRRQGIGNAIYYYIGMALGYLNLGLLMTKLLSTENLGLRQVVFQVGSMFGILAVLGSPNILNRFFPEFRNKNDNHGGILYLMLIYWVVGVLFASAILLIFQDQVVEHYRKESELLVDFYLWLIPFGAFMSLFEILAAYSRVLLHTVVPVFVREFGVRVFTTALLGLLYLKFIDFEIFFALYLIGYGVSAIVLLFYLARIGELKFGLMKQIAWLARLKEMIVFGLFTWFNNSMSIIVKTTDVAMISYFISLSASGIYGFGALIGNVVLIPTQGLREVTAPLVANLFGENKMDELRDLYKKTSMIQLILGLWIFLIIVVNLEIMLGIWRTEFMESKWVVFALGSAKLVEVAVGINNRIITESKYFRYNLYFNLLMGVLVVVTNLIFIPRYGIMGAALASAMTMAFMGVVRVAFVYIKFRFQPFSINSIWVVLIAAIAFFASFYIPQIGIIPVDVLIRTTVFCMIFFPSLLYFRISEDMNKLVFDVLSRLKNGWRK